MYDFYSRYKIFRKEDIMKSNRRFVVQSSPLYFNFLCESDEGTPENEENPITKLLSPSSVTMQRSLSAQEHVSHFKMSSDWSSSSVSFNKKHSQLSKRRKRLMIVGGLDNR